MLVFVSSALAGPVDIANFAAVTVPTPPQDETKPYCVRTIQPSLRFMYEIHIPHVPDPHTIGKVCNNLWSELKGWGGCLVSPKNGCELVEGGNKTLKWYFHVSVFCNEGMVRSAFWEGTYHGAFGDIKSCKKEVGGK
jgi:hypothetical protein